VQTYILAQNRYRDFRVVSFYCDSPCAFATQIQRSFSVDIVSTTNLLTYLLTYLIKENRTEMC